MDKAKLAKKIANSVKKGKVPYKIVDDLERSGELVLDSPKASATAMQSSPEMMQEYDKAFESIAENEVSNPFFVPALQAEKGYGAKALSALEKAAKKRGADAMYLNASPLGGTRGLSQEEAAKKLQKFYADQGYQIANDQGTNTLMWKKLMAAGLLPGALTAGALAPTNEAEASPMNTKIAKKILSGMAEAGPKTVEEARAIVRKPAYRAPRKFDEPRAVLSRTDDASRLLMERPNAAPLALSGDSPDAAEKLYKDVVGDVPFSPPVDKEEIARRLKADRAASNAANPADSTEPGSSFASLEKAGRWLSAPQRHLAKKIAEAVGAKGDTENSEASFQNAVEAMADKLGVPPESVMGNVAKAGAVALGEVVADPLGMLPVGKMSKAVKSAPGVAKALEAGSKVLSPETAAQIERMRRRISLAELAQVLRPKKAAETAAGQLATKGAEVIKPTHIVKSRP